MAKPKRAVISHATSSSNARRFPSRVEIIEFLKANPGEASKRGIARAFAIRGDNRILLKDMLRDLTKEGLFEPSLPLAPPKAQFLPEILVLKVTRIDEDGAAIALPVVGDARLQSPVITLEDLPIGQTPLGVGDTVLASLTKRGKVYKAKPIRRVSLEIEKIVGIFEKTPTGGMIRPTDRRIKERFPVSHSDLNGAESGEIIVASLHRGARSGTRQAHVVERLGLLGNPRSISLIAIHQHGIPVEFTTDALGEAAMATPPMLGNRVDLREVPLVTIDGADARDYDDAVYAEPDTDAANPGGWHVIIAIADVAAYVKPGSALDEAAYERGNSVYFPDRVVPMLPEALSNGLCSLKPNEDRACLAVHLWLNVRGEKRHHQFVRGLMRSAARLTYEQAQAIHDAPETTMDQSPGIKTAIDALYGAYHAFERSRVARGTLDLNIPERKIELDPISGAVIGVAPRARLDSHRLIEEFMIAANVAAAEALEAARQPVMYRIHDEPSAEKIEALRDFLQGLGLPFAKGQVITPKLFMQLLTRVKEQPNEALINQIVLRSQSQAAYSPDNIGHFGLALARYAHFTSPIRRYADLLVHRALIKGLRLGSDGLPDAAEVGVFVAAGTHISATERRAAAAERDATDRYLAAFLAASIGEEFTGTIVGVTNFGLFVALGPAMAEGLLPMRELPGDYYHYDAAHHRLMGKRSGAVFALGDIIPVTLADVDIATGSVALLYRGPTPASENPPRIKFRNDKALLQKRGKSKFKRRQPKLSSAKMND